MAEKQLARGETAEFDILADDDPLAELARIVGYDNRPAVQQLQELARHRDLVSREPVPEAPSHAEPMLDLESELMREFDVYDAPAVQPASRVVELPAVSVPQAAEPDFALDDAVEPAWGQYEDEAFLPAPEVETLAPVDEIELPVAQEPVFAPVDVPEIHVPEIHLSEIHVPEIHVIDEAAGESFMQAPEIVSAESNADWPVDQQDDLVFDGADLERELELSIGYDDSQIEAPEAKASATPPQRFEPELDLGPGAAEDLLQAPVVEEQAAFEAVDAAIVDNAPQATPVAQPAPAAETVISQMDPRGIDALLADIEQFPVPPQATVKGPLAQETSRKVNYPFTPTFSRATPVASNGGVSAQKAFATPLPAAVVAAPMAVATETAYQPAETPVEPVIVEAAEALKLPVDDEPDFDLDTFELDLAGIDLDIDPSEFEMAAQQTAFAPVETVAAAPVAEAPVASVAEVQAHNPAQAPFVDLPEFEEPVSQEPESVLPFDPSMISETEENLTAMAELHVPQLPVVEQERPVVQQPDYDLDIDAEMAQLFGTPNRGARNPAQGAQDDNGFGAVPQSAAAQPVGNGVRVEDDFDEFEKAMEEDFRLSLSQRQDTDPSSDRLAVGSGYSASNDDYDDERGPVKRRLMMLAAAVAVVAVVGGAGVYAFMGGNAPGLSGDDPKIILADKSPVKMVPAEKGGKTVPNQDKAVYDRVAGAQDTTPQQDALVSSTEEPIDVVQRTLTPENLPLEGRADEIAGLTPIDDEGGDRLLPDDQSAENAQADATPAVSPRKVRTMIVKPDGTLVAREDVATQPETQVASSQSDPQVKTVKTTVVTPQAETAKALPQEKSALAEAADATVEETAPVRSVKTSTVADTNPVQQAKPVEKPTTVVDTFKETQPAAEEKPIETASIAPGSYVVQIASLPSEAEAQKSYKTLSGKFGGVIGGKGVDIKRAEIAGKGTYYRVRIPAGSREAANALCAQYKSAGGSCLVTK
ncbi:MAG TPA: SPOR domain-containing protein [Pararhizobium sp.]|uniref:SPOR domain-containing protein n=1 Tax=Pararhizobium sp. TaxID=1977563 RepID=UPI002CA2E92E|nr:SPOR domain-containing protein [Pararhizobium sp.]HTO32640.1 SPOR domain-containing protein [Pararhizobium sp.]